MIKFFRKIRQNLLSEGKTGKYFKYAIGEIVLVVIGILIALSINNWNESRKNLKTKINYIESFKRDLSLDTLDLSNSIKFMKADLDYHLFLSERISSQFANKDTLIKIIRFEYSPYFNPANNLNNKTFEQINSVGQLNLLDSWMTDLIIKHNSFQLQMTKVIDMSFVSLYESLLEFSKKYPIMKQKTDAFGNPLFKNNYGILDDQFWRNSNEQELIGAFNGLLSMKIQNQNNIIQVRQYLLNETKKVLDTLNLAYNN